MVDFTICHSSSLSELGIVSWKDIPAVADAYDRLLITRQGHLAERRQSPLIVDAMQDYCLRKFHGQRAFTGFNMGIYCDQKAMSGNALFIEDIGSVKPYAHPNAWGDFTNQASEFTTITVVASRKVLQSVLMEWRQVLKSLVVRRESVLCISTLHRAIQCLAYHDEFAFEDHIDLTLAALLAIRYAKGSSLILGRSMTEALGKPISRVTTDVDARYGPFREIAIETLT